MDLKNGSTNKRSEVKVSIFKSVLLMKENLSIVILVAGKIDLEEIEFAICLDSIGRSDISDENVGLFMHYSKPPKEGQASYDFLKVKKF